MPVKTIAEFCQNHNGNIETLKAMIWAAAEAGADYGKIQTIFADDLSFRQEFEEGKADASGKVEVIKRPFHAEHDRLKNLELTYPQHRWFIEECTKAGITPMTTAFTVQSISHLRDMGWPALKIASYDCGSLPLIKEAAGAAPELIISTGASFDDEIEAAAACLKAAGRPFSLLHCVTIYPTPLEHMHLRRMDYLRTFTPSVGLSDHSLAARDGVKASLAAIHLGADIIERHFSILPADQTRDGRVSIDQTQLAELKHFSLLSKHDQKAYIAEHVPEFDRMLGEEKRELSHEERLNRAYYRGRFCNKKDGQQIFNWEYTA